MNQIGPEGAKHFAEALKVNKTLKELDLQGLFSFFFFHFLKTSCSLFLGKGNEIGDEGVEYIAEALKVNQTLQVLDLPRNHKAPFGCFFFFYASC